MTNSYSELSDCALTHYTCSHQARHNGLGQHTVQYSVGFEKDGSQTMSRTAELLLRKNIRTEALSVVRCRNNLTRNATIFIFFIPFHPAYLTVFTTLANQALSLSLFLSSTSTSSVRTISSEYFLWNARRAVAKINGKNWRPRQESDVLFTLRSSQTTVIATGHHGHTRCAHTCDFRSIPRNTENNIFWFVDNILSFEVSGWVVKN